MKFVLQVSFFFTLLQALEVFSAAVRLQQELTLDTVLEGSLKAGHQGGAVTKGSSFSSSLLPLSFTGCRSPWVLIGEGCLYADLSKDMTWQEGRNFCRELYKGADLVTFKDANEFAEALHYVKTLNVANTRIHFWFGGSDLKQNDEWLWITGEPMPRGSPFWGVDRAGDYEPNPKDGGHCGFLYHTNRYYLHDVGCEGWTGHQISPLCQYRPSA